MIAVVPAFNEAESIGTVLTQLADEPNVTGVVVVDDGSRDATASIARTHDATVLRLPYNLGVGGAVRAGLRYCVEHHGNEAVVVIDADGQHVASDIARLADGLAGGVNMVIGSRFADEDSGYEMSRVRSLAHGGLNRVIRAVSGFHATDATSGFRAFDRDAVALLAERYPVEFLADTVEVILLVRDAGMTVIEVPVSMRPRQGGVPSKRTAGLLFNYGRLLVGVLGAAATGRATRSKPARPGVDEAVA